ncbi:hypothetical protein GALMADRAFT_1330174 [Galerina marginata CBS 339.88]|uniref:Alpha-type protein kinase domain-containing protein n=1 Tax=Galerina marginata (strain CBS 339.88) TaxID=685588 RepID=A0A067SBK5_GALM3|nr:hypothetical protein GALMADRAFT_1330174 [Galerina marginata CBS 339.88]
MGARQLVTILRQEYRIKAAEKMVLAYLNSTEREAVESRKQKRFRRKRFWAAGVNDLWTCDQHDKWKRFGLWLHLGLDPYPGQLQWLKVWWSNRNPQLIGSYYLEAARKRNGVPLVTQSDRGWEMYVVANIHTNIRHALDASLSDTLQHRWCFNKSNVKPEILWMLLRRNFTPGFENIFDHGVNNGWYDINDPVEKLVFRWLAVPWIQAELDAWMRRFNGSPRRADKHKVLPKGIPDLIASKPHLYHSTDYKIDVSPELFDTMEERWAPRNLPVFQLVPPPFEEQANALYTGLGRPAVSSSTFWDVYKQLLSAFRALPMTPLLDKVVLAAAVEVQEEEVPLLPGLRDLRYGNDEIGDLGYVYYGGLNQPPALAPSTDSDEEDVPDDLRDYVDFTADNTKAIRCGRTDCTVKFYPAATEFHYLHSNDPLVPGRAVCTPCYQFYLTKKTTRRRPPAQPLPPPSSSTMSELQIHEQQVQKRIVKAQKNAGAASIQHIGTPVFAAGTALQTQSTQASRPSGPMIQLPGLFSPSAPSFHSQSVRLTPGYNVNHIGYQATRAKMASNAYAGNSGQIILVEVRAVCLPEGKVKPMLIGDLLVVVPNIPVHIGAIDLKSVLYQEILPQWLRYAEQYPLDIMDIIMRNKDWVEIHPKDPDRDAILSPSFFKSAKNASQTIFKGGKSLVYFHIPNKVYGRYEAWLEERDYQNLFSNGMVDQYTVTSESREPAQTATSLKGKKRTHTKAKPKPLPKPETRPSSTQDSERQHKPTPTVINLTSQPNSPTSSPPAKRTRTKTGFKSFHLNQLDTSPDKAALDSALRAQKHASPQDVQFLTNGLSIVNQTSYIDVLVYDVKFALSFDELLTALDWRSHFDFEHYQDIRLFLDMSATGSLKKGAFKMAYFGKSSQPLFSGDLNICAKQSFYTKTKTVTRRDGSSVKIRQDIPYDGIKQAQDLIMEVTCLNWAHALLEMVYAFVKRWMDKRPAGKYTEIKIPEMRFVKAGLAIEQVNEGERRCFLLEEKIPESEGSFRKYLNNTSAVPCRFVAEDDNDRAEFLAFAQHVQYFKTKKRAYVADFQGGDTLLTDPQILTTSGLNHKFRELGYIFSEGNVPETFKSFETDHVCNHFCRTFGLPIDYEWDATI